MNSPHPYAGLFISIEGGEGAGKHTHMQLLQEHLEANGFLVSAGREPGSTWLGEQIRDLLQDPKYGEVTPLAELLLFEAARAEYVRGVVMPALCSGQVFISDRYTDSTLAYQATGLGISRETVDHLNALATGGLIPDITFLLDVPADIGLRRTEQGKYRARYDKIEGRGIVYHERVNEGYRRLAAEEPDRIVTVAYGEGDVLGMQRRMRDDVIRYIVAEGLARR